MLEKKKVYFKSFNFKLTYLKLPTRNIVKKIEGIIPNSPEKVK